MASFKLPDLPYPYEALEPYIDKETMNLHHKNHHNTYVTKLNAAVSGSDLASATLMEVQNIAFKKGGAIRNHGGGHYNHAFFWTIMCAPDKSGEPSPALAEAITASFGSIDAMKKEFTDKAVGLFGSGFCWLCMDKSGKLVVIPTSNQDNPLMDGLIEGGPAVPVLGLDVWEHAYYLKYQSRRPEYVAAWWNVVNWPRVSEYFEKHAKNGEPVPLPN
uniref:Superoxide dismutase n=1 Tax=Chromera velia CCMP2878 TaxID=1169474 RepID=A0A0G4HEN7_9ALVE|eukprot:Cvel_26697.t1-p1 / transcript=Cvel_26697.t1 / gene=Cvel_26697 / organism=Chromera_velia_CCMP2878 / gene_product=Superoxide dismutase [Mn], putative / transcript_product=Superoxide dismutase [Mn], putative / location=Cvel_scaffold3216:6368-7888(-) / protein_length=216 / sequence_SO=supercontig / SO=protein_coding / is_pseudo=false